jgi:salicylate hydroxylase
VQLQLVISDCTGERIGYVKWGEFMDRDYNAPYYHIHRADYHRMLFALAKPYMKLELNAFVTEITTQADSSTQGPRVRPKVTLATGKTFTCDLLIGADGVKSFTRTYVVGKPDAPHPTGDCAYRAVIPTSTLLADPFLSSLVEHPEMTGWMGPGRHIMGYCIRAKNEYNMVLIHPDDGSVESWEAEGSAEKMRKDFEDYEPRVRKLLSYVPSTLKWKLMDRAPLSRWIDRSGKVVLMGDAAHPMLPYRAQGAAMAVEDAAMLGNLFSNLTSYTQITPLLQGFFDLRYPRTSATQLSSRLNQKIFHLPDGPDQEERDTKMKEAMKAELESIEHGWPENLSWEDSPNQWADKRKNVEQFLYDADLEGEKWWEKNRARLGEGVAAVAAGSEQARL